MNTEVTEAYVGSAVLALPELAAWPEVASLFVGDGNENHVDWEMPLVVCRAVGGDEECVLPAVAGIACVRASCILVDDILDEDPDGAYVEMGSGRAANLALALLAAGFALTERCPVDPLRQAALSASLAHMALVGASGQELDSQNLPGEEHYWRVVQAKSRPFYAGAFEMGALAGGAAPDLARSLYDLGGLVGEIVQILDDLEDTFQVPASPDWQQSYKSLPILFAETADHPQRERFAALMSRISDPEALREAQEILIRCGAVSYCVYHLMQRQLSAQELLARLSLANPALLSELLDYQIKPLVEWLHRMGIAIPPGMEERLL